jgi:Protein-tyrosine phosphatase
VGERWDPSAPGIVQFPSGRLVRGRGLARPLPAGPSPTFAVYLLGQPPPAVPWESRWLRWPDFRLPADGAEVLAILTEAWQRAAGERVEIACTGGRGRTGTALACLAILDGVPPASAVAFVRMHYDRHAVETFRQRRYVARWRGLADERGHRRQEYASWLSTAPPALQILVRSLRIDSPNTGTPPR